MIDLHLVTWMRPKMTELVIRTIERNTKSGTYNLMIWDNTPDNIGLEAARQILLEQTTTEYFVCIDNDCLPPEGWLPAQFDLMEKYENYAAISQRTQVMIGTGNIFEQTDKIRFPITDFPHPGGSFRMMRTDAVRKVGGWDRNTPGRGAEERYICGKLREAGYGTAFATNIRCLHLFGDRNTTKERWGYDEMMKPEDSGHSDIWHPALENGDNFEDVAAFAGDELARSYFDYSYNKTN